MKKIINPIGENLQAAREYLGLTVQQVANILGISAQEIENYENSIFTPDSTMIINFSNLYGITCLDILTKHKHIKNKDKRAVAELIKFKNEIKK